MNNTSKDLTVEGLTVNAEHEDAQRDNYGNVYDCNVNAVYEESDAEKGDTGDTKTETERPLKPRQKQGQRKRTVMSNLICKFVQVD